MSADISGFPPLARNALCCRVRSRPRVAIPARPVTSAHLPSLEQSAALGRAVRRLQRSICGPDSPVKPQMDDPPEPGEKAPDRLKVAPAGESNREVAR